ncbi:MAG: hypothetical protein NC293_04960 [Roseburia sp.]|nr:hypothetical protein [Roseburia sp.]
MKKIKCKTKRFINKYHYALLLLIIIMFFPIIMGILHALLIKQFLDIGLDSLLSFYRVAAGIFTSYLTYTYESKKNRIERIKKIKPDFSIEIEKLNDSLFALTVENHSSSPI